MAMSVMMQRVTRSARPTLLRAALLSTSSKANDDPLLTLLEQVAAGKVRNIKARWHCTATH